MLTYNTSVQKAKDALLNTNKKFVQLLQHGSMIVEYYAPDKIDMQTPHKQDELYVIISGTGEFIRDNETIYFSQNDILLCQQACIIVL